MNRPVFFGIDGGGTYSRLVLVNENGEVIARAHAGSTNVYSVSRDEVFANLSNLLDFGLSGAGLRKKVLVAGCVGSAGLGREGEQKIFREFFDRLLGSGFPVKFCSDAEILLCGGLENLEGYCLIAGTGSIALGRTVTGDLVRAGGHGYMLGDEGGGAWIGRTAIARTLRSLENRDLPTDMLSAILSGAGLRKSSDLIQYVHHDADKPKIAALAPLVTAAARNNDPLALDILHTGARELAALVQSVISRSPAIANRELVLAGGVVEHDEILTGTLRNILNETLPGLVVSVPQGTVLKGTALKGACLLAIDLYRSLS